MKQCCCRSTPDYRGGPFRVELAKNAALDSSGYATKYGDAEVISYSPSTATLTVDTLQRDGTLTPLLRQGNLSSTWDLIVPAYHLS